MKPFLTLLTALLLALLAVLHADDAPSKLNADNTLMLAGDWVPEDPHQIDYEKLPRVKAEHTIISDVRDHAGTRVHQHAYLACVATISFPGWRQLEVPVDDCVA